MTSTVIPTLRYQDAEKAVEFLVEAFGFTADNVFNSDEGFSRVTKVSSSMPNCRSVAGW